MAIRQVVAASGSTLLAEKSRSLRLHAKSTGSDSEQLVSSGVFVGGKARAGRLGGVGRPAPFLRAEGQG